MPRARCARSRTPGAFASIYRLMLRNQATIGRVLAVMALGVGGMLLGLAVGLQNTVDPMKDGAELVNRYGLTILVPVVTLVFSSSTLGDLVDDRTLVYLWLRPVNRLTVAAAAAGAAMTICLPAVTVPLVISATLHRWRDRAGRRHRGRRRGRGGRLLRDVRGPGPALQAGAGVGPRVHPAVGGLRRQRVEDGEPPVARAYTRSVVSQYTGVRLDQADLRSSPPWSSRSSWA